MNKEYIKITPENRTDIIRSYAHNMIEDMDIDALYSFAYRSIIENKEDMSTEDLTKEIMNSYPYVLEYMP